MYIYIYFNIYKMFPMEDEPVLDSDTLLLSLQSQPLFLSRRALSLLRKQPSAVEEEVAVEEEEVSFAVQTSRS